MDRLPLAAQGSLTAVQPDTIALISWWVRPQQRTAKVAAKTGQVRIKSEAPDRSSPALRGE